MKKSYSKNNNKAFTTINNYIDLIKTHGASPSILITKANDLVTSN